MATITMWGTAQQTERIARGLTFYSTASHGGFLIGKIFAEKNLSEAARRHGVKWGTYLAYEEDCLADIIYLEVPETRKKLLNPNLSDSTFIESLARWVPTYLEERGINCKAKTCREQ